MRLMGKIIVRLILGVLILGTPQAVLASTDHASNGTAQIDPGVENFWMAYILGTEACAEMANTPTQ